MILGIYGSGGAGREVKDIAEELDKWDEIVFIDDTVEADIYQGISREPFSIFKEKYPVNDSEIVITVGDPNIKELLYDRVKLEGYHLANIIHNLAWVSPTAQLGEGVILRAGVVVNSNVLIGNNVTIQENSCIGHDSQIGDNCHISSMVATGGFAKIGRNNFIGIGTGLRDRVSVGDMNVIGMGTVVTKDIGDNKLTYGNPMKMQEKPQDFSLFKH